MPELRMPTRVGGDPGRETPTLLQHPAGSILVPRVLARGRCWVPAPISSPGDFVPIPGLHGGCQNCATLQPKKYQLFPGSLQCSALSRAEEDGMERGRKWEDLGFLAQNEPLGCGGGSLRGGRERLRRARRAAGKLRHGACHAVWLLPTQKPCGAHRLHPASRAARGFVLFWGEFLPF